MCDDDVEKSKTFGELFIQIGWKRKDKSRAQLTNWRKLAPHACVC